MANLKPASYEQLRAMLKARLTETLETEARSRKPAVLTREAICAQLRHLLSNFHGQPHAVAISVEEQERLIAELANEIVGSGPLEPLMHDPEVTEIMVNGPRQVYVERQGRLERTGVTFRDSEHLLSTIERLLMSVGNPVTESEPYMDATLPDGSRLNIVIPPIVLGGPAVTIRKKLRPFNVEDFIGLGSLSNEVAEFLIACVKAKVNLAISGGTSTGKTTLVSVLSAFIPEQERIITIENIAELELPKREHWIRMVARPPNIEGRGEVSLRSLLRNALHMRPDRIILGEARAGEALDVVQAMHSGHDGVITVLHANSPQAALERFETLMLMSGVDIPPQTCQAQIASALDAIVHMARFVDGSRRIASIAHVLSVPGGGFQAEELFAFEARGFQSDGRLEGNLRYTGLRPKFLQKFQLYNVPIPKWMGS